MFQIHWKTLGVLIFASLVCSASFALAQEVGTLEVEEGQVVIIRGTDTQEADEGDEVAVFAKDTVQTLEESFALLILGDDDNSDQISLDEKTTFLIEEYGTPEGEETTRGAFSVIGGKVRSLVNQAKGKKDIKLRTTSAVIGVKGTDFLTEVPNPDVTQVTTFEGTVSLQNRLGDVLQEVNIESGFSSLVLFGNPPSSPFELSRESLLESSSLSTRSVARTPTESPNAQDLIQENTLQGFNKAQFDRLVEEAARVSGSLIRVKIEFPQTN